MLCQKCDHHKMRGLQLCSHCGALLGSAKIARRVHRKHLQLRQVGLVGGLLEKRRRKTKDIE